MDTPGLGFLENDHVTCTVVHAAFYETSFNFTIWCVPPTRVKGPIIASLLLSHNISPIIILCCSLSLHTKTVLLHTRFLSLHWSTWENEIAILVSMMCAMVGSWCACHLCSNRNYSVQWGVQWSVQLWGVENGELKLRWILVGHIFSHNYHNLQILKVGFLWPT